MPGDGADLKFWQQRAATVKPGMKRGDVEPLFLPVYTPPGASPFTTALSNGISITMPWPRAILPPPEFVFGAHYIVLYWVAPHVTVTINYNHEGNYRDSSGDYHSDRVNDKVNSIIVEPRAPSEPITGN